MPAGESPLGQVIADAQLAATSAPDKGGAVIAFTNPGGIRTGLKKSEDGTVTYADLFAAQPFGNNLVTLTLTGAQIKTLLEQQWLDQPKARSLQVSKGFSYTWDDRRQRGDFVPAESITLDGRPIEANAKYRVTVNAFLADGGDGFSVLKEGDEPMGGPLEVPALEAYFKAKGMIGLARSTASAGVLSAGCGRTLVRPGRVEVRLGLAFDRGVARRLARASRRSRSAASTAPSSRAFSYHLRAAAASGWSDDVELDQLVGVIGGGRRYGALRQARRGRELEELARGVDVAALQLLDALGMEAHRALALRGIHLRDNGGGRGGRWGYRSGLHGRPLLGCRHDQRRPRFRQDAAVDVHEADENLGLALEPGRQDEGQRRKGGKRHRPGARSDRMSLRQRHRPRQAADADECVLCALLRAELDLDRQARGRLAAQDRRDLDGNGLGPLRLRGPDGRPAQRNRCRGGHARERQTGNTQPKALPTRGRAPLNYP